VTVTRAVKIDPVHPDADIWPERPGHGTSSARSPWTDSRFWLLQLTILALTLVRLAVTVAFGLDTTDAVLVVSTALIFMIPVVVASLNFGLPGGLAATVWVAVLDIPRIVDAARHDRMPALWSEVLQLAVLLTLSLLIGSRVTAETRFRDQVGTARTARLHTELLYRNMFESNHSPILIVDGEGRVVESNAAADRVFDWRASGAAVGRARRDGERRLVDVVGPEAAGRVLIRLLGHHVQADALGSDSADSPGNLPVDAAGHTSGDGDVGCERPLTFELLGRRILYRLMLTLVGDSGSDRRVQVIFEDVTSETRRHDLMEAYAGQVVLGQEEARRHIAQELHDGPLQALIHVCRQIDSLVSVQPVPRASKIPDRELLASMRSSVEDTVAELRSIARGLRPSVLDDLGLVASINQLVTDATDRQGFDSSFTVDGTVTRLPSATELAVFRVAQEAVTNAEHHAEAHQVAVALKFGDGWLGLTVSDDGVGFDSQSPFWEENQSLGLPGMTERARLVGGRLRVTSQVGIGTTVDVLVPIVTPGRP
jgi:signal transduction histidine kinase